MITQCPNCATSFRVSTAQLTVAQGAVRCGACLQVFPADQHVISDSGDARSDQIEQPMTQPAEGISQPEENMGQPEEKMGQPEEKMGQPGQQLEWNVLQGEDEDSGGVLANCALSDPELEDPEQIVRLLVKEEMDQLIGLPASENDSEDFAARVEDGPARREDGPARREDGPARREDGPARREDGPAVAQAKTGDAVATDQILAVQDALQSVDFGDRSTADLSSEEDKLNVANNLYFNPDEEIEIHPPGVGMLRWFGWALLNLLLIVSLAGQFGWFHKAELSQQEELRDWYEMLCNRLPCELVDFTDVSKIKTRKLIVRSHPDVDEALIVDAIIFNDSEFAQPFPLLYLSFSDMDNKLVASRRFRPIEYIAGELTGNHKIPAQTEVHVALEIVDPGTSAVSYQLMVQTEEKMARKI